MAASDSRDHKYSVERNIVHLTEKCHCYLQTNRHTYHTRAATTGAQAGYFGDVLPTKSLGQY